MNKLKQSTKQNQRKVLSQQTRQAINILQFNSLDLHKEIEDIILENPFLEQENTLQITFCLVSPGKMRKNHKWWNKTVHAHKVLAQYYLNLAFYVRN